MVVPGVVLPLALLCQPLVLAGNASSAVGGRLRDQCEPLRRGNNRVLLLINVDKHAAIMYVGAFAEAGWEVGLLTTWCTHEVMCELDEWVVNDPAPLRYIFRGKDRTLKSSEVLAATREYKPSLVLADLKPAVLTLHRTVAVFAHTSDQEKADAVLRIRCSLPPRKWWAMYVYKSRMISLGERSSGVRVPLSTGVSREGVYSEERLQRIMQVLPVVIKSDRDGAGKGVQLCPNVSCVREALDRHRKFGNPCMIQQYVDGVTQAYESVFVDGHMLGGFAKVKTIVMRDSGVTLASTTVNNPASEMAMRKLFRHLDYTGIATADFVVDRQGRSFLVDVNPRLNANVVAIPGGILGIEPGLLVRLREAITGGGAIPGRLLPTAAPLPHSVTYTRFHPNLMRKGVFDIMWCDDVFVPIHFALAKHIHIWSKGRLEADPDTCTLTDAGRPGLRIGRMCSGLNLPCEAACRPVPRHKPLTTAAVFSTHCDPSGAWWRAHNHCAARQVGNSSSLAAFAAVDATVRFCGGVDYPVRQERHVSAIQ